MDETNGFVVDLRDAPVSIDLDALGDHDSVLTALAQYYERQGLATQQMWVGDLPGGYSTVFDLAIPETRLLIDVETIDTLISLDAHRYDGWRKAGYEVWIVAPHDKLDLVKRRMKGNVDYIQGWTMDDSKVKFEHPVR
jgi:hypothetical protein